MATPETSSSARSVQDFATDTPASLNDTVVLKLEYGQAHWTLLLDADEKARLERQFSNFCSQKVVSKQSEPETVEQDQNEALLLASEFLSFLILQEHGKADGRIILREIQRYFLRDTDIHSAASTLDEKAQASILKSYYAGLQYAHVQDVEASSALLGDERKPELNIYAVFGGQGSSNEICLQELQELYDIYGSLVEDLLAVAADTLSNLYLDAQSISFTSVGDFDLKRWLKTPESAPSKSIIATAPFSFPLIGLVSLSHLCVTCKALGRTPGQLRDSLQGTTGHSQGVIIAAVLAASSSWESFYQLARLALTMLFWIGTESHRETRFSSVPFATAESCIKKGEGQPSPMLSIRGLDVESVAKLINVCNKSMAPDEQVSLALINARDNVVIAGPPRSLYGLNARLRDQKVPDDLDQSRILFSRRKPVIRHEFLPMSAPFHSQFGDAVVHRVMKRLLNFTLNSNDLGIRLFHTKTRDDLGDLKSHDIIQPLIRMITSEQVDWPSASSFPGATHVIDFGPGQICSLVQKSTEGTGVRAISASELQPRSKTLGAKAKLFSRSLGTTPPIWAHKYRPRLVKDALGNSRLETKMTQMMRVPPIMVAGMTPTTVPWDFVASIMQAGYHAELAGGGYQSPEHFEAAIKKLSAEIPLGSGITCNIIYASPKVVAWQIPLLRQLTNEGYPIDGLTIGAGVPSPETVDDYVNSLGLKHISFKPGSQASILQVVNIAKTHPRTTIGLQWTGGRGGGHHSFEDFHRPILNTYAQIRECDNIVLVAGSGFGGAEDTLPYLTGGWSLAMGYPQLPFDGVLLGSRVMASREAHTSLPAKELIVQAEGVDDEQWHESYDRETGGVITVTSEFGQPIHKLATRGVLLWKDLDRTIFSISDPSKRLQELQPRRNEIINRLNQDFQKPWFGRDSQGFPSEIEDMTYYDILRRLVALMYVKDQHRWIDPSYLIFVIDFTTRACERLGQAESPFTMSFNDPINLPEHLLRTYPDAAFMLLHPEDASHFISLCRRRGQKPVNFIPKLDENFETWFKKDSLWQAEDIDAVIDRDVQRTCIIHGPVAARYSRTVNEPVKQILDRILNSWKKTIAADPAGFVHTARNQQDERATETPNLYPNLIIDTTRYAKSYTITDDIVDEDLFLQYFGNQVDGWARACVLEPSVIRGQHRHENPIRKALVPTLGHILVVERNDSKQITALKLKRVDKFSQGTIEPLIISSRDGTTISAIFTESTFSGRSARLELVFGYSYSGTAQYLFEIPKDRIAKVKTFYSELWLGSYPKSLRDSGIHSEFTGPTMIISSDLVHRFIGATDGRVDPDRSRLLGAGEVVPIGVCITIAWEALVQPLLGCAIDGDLSQLLHRSNEFRYVEGASPLLVDDVVDSISQIQAVTNSSKGKEIEVVAMIRRDGESVITITSKFFIRGVFQDHERTFRRAQEPRMCLHLKNERDWALLKSRTWAQLSDDTSKFIGQRLIFDLDTQTTYNQDGTYSTLRVMGTVLVELNGKPRRIGSVLFETGHCHGNPVMGFLERHGSFMDKIQHLKNTGWNGKSSWSVRVPTDNTAYARVSKDTNPIHVSPVFAKLAQCPGVVTHGMLTSEAVRRIVEEAVAEADFSRFRRYSASFEGMVFAGDELEVDFQHNSMSHGRMVLKIQARSVITSTIVLEAEAEVEQETTAYVFTGQGSQEKGMGMALYETSATARDIWDRADKYLFDLYGFSVLDIVRNDPKSLTVYFGGPLGRKLRQNYMNLTIQRTKDDGTVVTEPILQNLGPDSLSYTFSDSRGLLYSTQFAQPVLTLMEVASFEDAKSRGLIQEKAPFAGHSLGEYSALGAIGTVLSLESLMSLVFYRGLAMQVAMERDSEGRTEFSMVAVNPSRVGKAFTVSPFETVVHTIAREMQLLLEIVNYNVEGRQYVCAGQLHALWTMSQVLNSLALLPSSTQSDPEKIIALVRQHAAQAKDLAKHPVLERGTASIPLKGIDVPFHSSHIRSGVEPYRRYLEEVILEENVDVEKLEGRWIPNVMGRPFELGREYVEDAARVMGSERLRSVLGEWDSGGKEVEVH